MLRKSVRTLDAIFQGGDDGRGYRNMYKIPGTGGSTRIAVAEVKRPLRNRFGSEMVTDLYSSNGHM